MGQCALVFGAVGDHDVAADGVGARTQSGRRCGRFGPAVDANVGEVCPERRLHSCPKFGLERRAGARNEGRGRGNDLVARFRRKELCDGGVAGQPLQVENQARRLFTRGSAPRTSGVWCFAPGTTINSVAVHGRLHSLATAP